MMISVRVSVGDYVSVSGVCEGEINNKRTMKASNKHNSRSPLRNLNVSQLVAAFVPKINFSNISKPFKKFE